MILYQLIKFNFLKLINIYVIISIIINKIQLKLSHVIYIYIKKAKLFTNIYFKSTLQLLIFASYHVL